MQKPSEDFTLALKDFKILDENVSFEAFLFNKR